MQILRNSGPLSRLLLRRDQRNQPENSLTPFQQLSVQAYGQPVTLHPQQVHRQALLSNSNTNGRIGVRNAETDLNGRRGGPVNPEEHGAGIEDEVLPAYEFDLKRPPRYQDIMGLTRGPDGDSLHSDLPDRHPADRDAFELEGLEGETSRSAELHLSSDLNHHNETLLVHENRRSVGGEEHPPEYSEDRDEG